MSDSNDKLPSYRSKYTHRERAEVLVELLMGASQQKVADEHKIPVTTVDSWWRRARGELPSIREEQKAEIGRLLLEYLHSGLRAAQAQHAVMADPAWLQEQGARGMAALYGVLVDKLVRLLEALEPMEVQEHYPGKEVPDLRSLTNGDSR